MNKIPNSIIQQIKASSPRYHSPDNFGRRGGFDGDDDEYSASYKSICIYVQNGLAEQNDLFDEISRKVFTIQSNNSRQYPLMIFGFGNTAELQSEKKYFHLGLIGSLNSHPIISETISRISGHSAVNPAIIPEFFPKTDNRSLYLGKTKIEPEDLLIIIGFKGEVFFSEALLGHKKSLLKQIFFVEIDADKVIYSFGKHIFEYRSITE